MNETNISVHLEKEQRARISEASKEANLTISSFVRKVILDFLDGKIK